MPLLNICAITGNNMVIQVGLAFLSGEKEIDYNWAIDYIRETMAEHSIEEPSSIVTDRELALIKCLYRFPASQHILCRWHVNMNVLAKTKGWFPAPVRVNGTIQRHPQFQDFICSWNALLASPTEHIYNQKLAEIQAKYPAPAVRYCTSTWLLWKENLVACYINQRSHFGVTVTSPIEGCHATLKAYLQRGHGSLKGVYDKLKLFWTAQHATIQTTIAQQQLAPKHSVNVPLFAAVLKQVHGNALQRILVEAKKLPARGAPPTSCMCSIQQSIGLPCYHTIYQRKLTSGVIYLEDIHPHWYFSRPELGLQAISHPLPVLEPLVVQGRGRPHGALGRVAPTSTRREPSAFELPSSSAPPALAPTEQLYIVNSGLSRLQNGHQDLYEPGTQGGRAYMRGLSSIWQTDLVDVATAAIELIEREVVSGIEVDEDTIEVEIN
jgi:MULE transposase domain